MFLLHFNELDCTESTAVEQRLDLCYRSRFEVTHIELGKRQMLSLWINLTLAHTITSRKDCIS